MSRLTRIQALKVNRHGKMLSTRGAAWLKQERVSDVQQAQLPGYWPSLKSACRVMSCWSGTLSPAATNAQQQPISYVSFCFCQPLHSTAQILKWVRQSQFAHSRKFLMGLVDATHNKPKGLSKTRGKVCQCLSGNNSGGLCIALWRVQASSDDLQDYMLPDNHLMSAQQQLASSQLQSNSNLLVTYTCTWQAPCNSVGKSPDVL